MKRNASADEGQQPTAKRFKEEEEVERARPDLINAVKAADIERTTRLLDDGHDANILYRRGGWTPLIVAAMDSNYEPRIMPEIMSLLIKRGANVNKANQVGCTSLAAALPYLIRAIPHSTALPLSTAREVSM